MYYLFSNRRLDNLLDLIEKLPKGPEFGEIKETLRRTNEKVRETLEPTEEAYDRAKNLEKRMIENDISRNQTISK
ncbi:MAG: hypothetical protein KGI25_09025 [Thaumarchaeota archaeon]|nr:hypothetical protein [Nitrososphaerota archaeon]